MPETWALQVSLLSSFLEEHVKTNRNLICCLNNFGFSSHIGIIIYFQCFISDTKCMNNVTYLANRVEILYVKHKNKKKFYIIFQISDVEIFGVQYLYNKC